MKRQTLLVAIGLMGSMNISAQSMKPEVPPTLGTDNGGHENHQNEIGIANSPVYFLKEKRLSYGLHIHYIRKIGHSKFGIGLGYEKIFDEHNHNTIGVVAAYRPIEKLSLQVSPGLTFEDDSDVQGSNFALHVESTYEFEFNNFHVGPVIEFAYDPEDIHVSLGVHVGIGF